MGLSSFLRPFFSTAFIGVDVDGRFCKVYVLARKNGQTKEEFCKEFKAFDNKLPAEAAKLIRAYKRKYPFTYLGSISKTYNQGVIDTTQRVKLSKFGIKPDENLFIRMRNWACYIQKRAVAESRARYLQALGLDFLFSPFIMIYTIIAHKMLRTRNCLYVLQQRSNISLLVADKKNVFFGGYFPLSSDLEGIGDDDNEHSEISSILDMKNIDGLAGTSPEELRELGELDGIDEEVLEQEIAPKELKNRKKAQGEQARIEELRDLARANDTSEIITNCVSEFYSNDMYKSDFLDKIILLDTYGISNQAVEHIRNSLLMDIEVRPVDVTKTLIELMQRENP